MSYFSGRATITGTTSSFVVGFQPTWATFRIAGKTTADTVSHFSLGSTDGTHQNCSSTFHDTTGSVSFDFGDRVVSHYERVGGTITEVVNATFVSFSASGGGVINLTSTVFNPNYKVTINCGN